MPQTRSQTLRVRITPEEEAWLIEQAKPEKLADYVRGRLFDDPTPEKPEQQVIETIGEYKPQKQYPSGNEGRHHPNLVHPGSRKWNERQPYVNEKRREVQRQWMQKRGSQG